MKTSKRAFFAATGLITIGFIQGTGWAKDKPAPSKSKGAKVEKKVIKAKPAAIPKDPVLSRINLPENFSLSGMLDIRCAHTDTDQGPPGAEVPSYGKTRYLGDGSKRRNLFRVSQLSVNFTWGMGKRWTLSGQLAADIEGKKARLTPQSFAGGGTFGFTYVMAEGVDIIGKHTLLRLGVLSAPFMNEYLGDQGEPLYTITPSAAGALLTTASPGVEFEWHTEDKPANASISLGLVTVLDDVPGLATDPVYFTPAVWSFDDTLTDYRYAHDVDGKPGYYLVGTLTDKEEVWQVNLGILDNLNNGLPENNGLGIQGYSTTMWSIGAKMQPKGGWTGQLQYMAGNSDWCSGAVCTVAPDNRSSVDYSSGNLLLSYKPKKHRYSVRYDWFATDLKGVGGFNGTEEQGNAWTVAWRRDLRKYRDISLEFIKVNNDPNFGAGFRVWDAKDNLFQASWRQFF